MLGLAAHALRVWAFPSVWTPDKDVFGGTPNTAGGTPALPGRDHNGWWGVQNKPTSNGGSGPKKPQIKGCLFGDNFVNLSGRGGHQKSIAHRVSLMSSFDEGNC
jgi:hypothetical protein